MLGATSSVGFRPPKKEKGPSELFGYRAPADQAAYLNALVEQGYDRSELLREAVRLEMVINQALDAKGLSLRGYVLAEGIARPAEVDEDASWLPTAIERLLLLGIEAYRRDHPDVSFGQPPETDSPEAPPRRRGR